MSGFDVIGGALVSAGLFISLLGPFLVRSCETSIWPAGLGMALLVVGAATSMASAAPRRPSRTIFWIGFVVLAGIIVNILIPVMVKGRIDWATIIPVFPPAGMDFRLGLYDPAVSFSSAQSAWPPLTLLVGKLFTLMGRSSAYIAQLFVLCGLGAGSTAIIAFLAESVTAPAGEPRRLKQRAGWGLFAIMLVWLFTSYGFLFELERGNINTYALFFSVAAVWALLRRPQSIWFPALLIALAISFKVYPAVLLVMLFWRFGFQAFVPAVVTNAALFLIAGPLNGWMFVTNLVSRPEMAFLWVGNHSARSFALVLRDATLWQSSQLVYVLLLGILLLVPIALWSVSMALVVRRGWSEKRALLAAAACVPIMCIVPTVSHDYKLILLVLPLTVVAAVVSNSGHLNRTLWSAIFGTLGVALILASRSTLLTPVSVLANKYPLIVVLQVLILVLIVLRVDEEVPRTVGVGSATV